MQLREMYFGVTYVGTVCRSDGRSASGLKSVVACGILTQERDEI
jgi:hypothetical protein